MSRPSAPPLINPAHLHQPNFYDGKYGKSPNDYLSCCFVNDWNAMAVPLSCPNGFQSCSDGQLAGPAWGHVHMAAGTLDWFLRWGAGVGSIGGAPEEGGGMLRGAGYWGTAAGCSNSGLLQRWAGLLRMPCARLLRAPRATDAPHNPRHPGSTTGG